MIMIDKTTDSSNKGQLTLVTQRIDEYLDAFDGCRIYCLSSTNVDSIAKALKYSNVQDTRCYNGCSKIAGTKGEVAAKIQQLEPKAVFTDCYGSVYSLLRPCSKPEC